MVIAKADPPQASSPPLRYADAEARGIQELFPEAHPIKNAMAAALIEHGRTANLLHYIGHASPYGLALHAERDRTQVRTFSVEDVFTRLDLPQTRLATLGACETGLTRVQGGADEYIGLPSAFLHAGAATVVSSLWVVDDYATSLLMRKMYRFMKEEGKGEAEALHQAQLWLKDPANRDAYLQTLEEKSASSTRDFRMDSALPPPDEEPPADLSDLSHPYYWAAFICSGVN